MSVPIERVIDMSKGLGTSVSAGSAIVSFCQTWVYSSLLLKSKVL